MSRHSHTVSVCIPTYNSERFLKETLDSLAVQTCRPTEVIVSDNASTDGTCDLVRRYRQRDILPLRLVENEANLGAIGNWNRLVGEARGDLVAIYHADDVYEPEMVERSSDAFEGDPSIGLVGTMGHVIDACGKRLYSYSLPGPVRNESGCRYSFDEVLHGMLLNDERHIFFITPSIMVRRSMYEEMGLFETAGRYASAADYEMWLRIAVRHPVAILEERLINYRVHENQGSEREVRQNLESPDILAVWEDYSAKAESPAVRALVRQRADQMLVITASKQNSAGMFDSSSATLARMSGEGYFFLRRLVLLMANRCRMRLRKRRRITSR